MASTFTPICSLAAPIRASYGSTRKSDPNRSKNAASPTWWAPLFGWSSDADYVNTTGNVDTSGKRSEIMSDSDSGRPKSKYNPGCFTEEKARQLRKKTMEGSTFHDIMYHSAIASRLASDVSEFSDK